MLPLRKAIPVLGLLALMNAALAAPITLNGAHFTATYDDAQAGPYGQGFLSGSLDTVYFQPGAFSALSGGSPASTPASLQLTFTIDPGYRFAGFDFAERGDYFLFGSGTVGLDSSLQAVNADTAASVILTLAPSAALDVPDEVVSWEATGSFASGLGMPQTLSVTLANELFADAPAGELGFIQKTYVGFRIATVAAPASVPEPSSWALLLAGMLAALLAGRRQVRVPGTRPERRDRSRGSAD